MKLSYNRHITQNMNDTVQPKKPRHFTRKHYTEIARVIRQQAIAHPENLDVLTQLAQGHCVMFKAEYPLFDGARFLKLCGLMD